MAVVWDVAACSLVELNDVSEVLAASIIRTMMETANTRLHGRTTQKTAMFVLTAVRTSNSAYSKLFSVINEQHDVFRLAQRCYIFLSPLTFHTFLAKSA
jgi:hypothetical protein